jgi:hypothetical protein
MVSDANDHVKIARWTRVRTGIAFSGKTDSLPIPCAGLNAHFQWFSPLNGPFAMTRRTIRNVFSGTMTARTLHIELHAPAGLGDLTTAAALRALSRRFDVTFSATIATGIAPSNVQTHDAAANGRPERDIDLVFKVISRFRAFFGGCTASTAEHTGEDVAEASGSARSLASAAALE